MARLQTFPDEVLIMGNHAVAQRQLGNAVPSLLAEILARAMREQLLGLSVSEAPLLLRPAAPQPPPPPGPIQTVPARYLALRGEHDAHPGTGKGYRALRAA
jgi:DNA (cytosine-5)-methyltransferase 1